MSNRSGRSNISNNSRTFKSFSHNQAARGVKSFYTGIKPGVAKTQINKTTTVPGVGSRRASAASISSTGPS
jgi:hypothetical protein